jgi:hypothetical protein
MNADTICKNWLLSATWSVEVHLQVILFAAVVFAQALAEEAKIPAYFPVS